MVTLIPVAKSSRFSTILGPFVLTCTRITKDTIHAKTQPYRITNRPKTNSGDRSHTPNKLRIQPRAAAKQSNRRRRRLHNTFRMQYTSGIKQIDLNTMTHPTPTTNRIKAPSAKEAGWRSMPYTTAVTPAVERPVRASLKSETRVRMSANNGITIGRWHGQ